VTTSENRQELDLFSQPHAIDVRLLKVMAFGENSGNIHPFTLRDRRSSYHRTNWAAKAQWEVDGDAWELPPSEEHPRSRWRIKLNGKFHRDQSVEMTESFEQKGMAIMVRSFDSTQMGISHGLTSLSVLCLLIPVPFDTISSYKRPEQRALHGQTSDHQTALKSVRTTQIPVSRHFIVIPSTLQFFCDGLKNSDSLISLSRNNHWKDYQNWSSILSCLLLVYCGLE